MDRSVTKLTLEELGFSASFAEAMPEGERFKPARVASVYAALVDVWTEDGPKLASLRSRALRDTKIEGGIAVGDWVAVGPAEGGSDEVVVECVLPRRTAFLRQAAGERAEPQAVAANVDVVFVATSVDGDVNLRRLERYLVAIRAGGAAARVIVTKADLAEDLPAVIAEIEAITKEPVFVTSARSGDGIDAVRAAIPRGTTAALVGSSGVGKSALVNRLLGRDAQLEGEVRAHDKRGRHTTTRRALFVVPDGGLLADMPGMRELKPWNAPSLDVDDAFEDVAAAGENCRYRDCRHAGEPGCGVTRAVEEGAISAERVDAWRKLEEEIAQGASRQQSFAAVEEKKRRQRSATVALRKRVREKR